MRRSKMEEEFKQDLISLVKIPSVYDSSGTPGAPFGQNVSKCLNRFLEIGEKLGYKAKDYDGYAGELDLGDGDRIIGILGHCDVVPAGEGWKTEPFDPVLVENRLYGRGSSDDKGALLACMYAATQLKDDGKIPEGIKIRIIIGTNEEEDWEDMPYYLQKTDAVPDYSIVPDAQFPVIYCEKGLYDVDIIYNHETPDSDAEIVLEDLNGGSARNAVAAKAEAVLGFGSGEVRAELLEATSKLVQNEIEKQRFDGASRIEDDKLIVTINGKNAHAMNPEKGINAGMQLIAVLNRLPAEKFSHHKFTAEYCRVIGDDYFGEKNGLACSDEESGKLTMSVGTYKMSEGGSVIMQASIRYPSSAKFEDIKTKTDQAFGGGAFSVTQISHMKPVYFKKTDPFVNLLMNVYRDVTGDKETQPISIGGATYARAIPNAIAFGPIFPWEEELAHEPNEFVDLDSLEKAADIYYNAIEKICGLIVEEES